jgi:Tfp pilus assembly protein PilF
MDRLERITDMLKANPADSFLQHALALEYIKGGNDELARQIFENILTQDPGYTGSYYHLAKLLERTNEKAKAIEWYEKGMAAAKLAGDNHTFGELRAAYEDLID